MKKVFAGIFLGVFLLTSPVVVTNVIAKPKTCKEERNECTKVSESEMGEALCWGEYLLCILMQNL